MPSNASVNGLQHFPLGHTFSGSPHSVCVSLPTMRDVIGYEEKDPRVLNALQSGYPRFFENPLVTKLVTHLRGLHGKGWDALLLCANRASANRAQAYARAGQVVNFEEGALTGVAFESMDSDGFRQAKTYLKRTGCGLSSRMAEAVLCTLGLIDRPFSEDRLNEGPEKALSNFLEESLGLDARWFEVTNSGMNAFYAIYEGVNELARDEGRRRWVRLGWLYVDTMEIIDAMGDPEFSPIIWRDLSDLEGLERTLAPIAHEIAGIIVEVPTNPLFEQVNLPRLATLSRTLGARLVVDPSLVSLLNAPDFSEADLVVSSLTKYTAGMGDVMAGLAIVNPQTKDAVRLQQAISRYTTPLSQPDTARLAYQATEAPGFVTSVNKSLPKVVDYLRNHSKVERVWHAESVQTPTLGGTGAVCSFLVRGSMPKFYDALEMAKGPSFGTSFSLVSPYMWLAHYDLVVAHKKNPVERLKSAAGYPDLLRLSVGIEGAQAIIAKLERAFAHI